MNCCKVSGLTKVSFSHSFLGSVCFCHKLEPRLFILSGEFKNRVGREVLTQTKDQTKFRIQQMGQPSSLCRLMRRFCLWSTVVYRAKVTKLCLLWRWPMEWEETYHFLYRKASDTEGLSGVRSTTFTFVEKPTEKKTHLEINLQLLKHF